MSTTDQPSNQKLHAHLCEQAILNSLIEGAPASSHVRDCPACIEESAQLASSLVRFRASVAQWSAREFQLQQLAPAPTSLDQRLLQWSRWAAAVAVLALAVLVPLYRHEQMQRREAALQADAELLQQVETDISRDVSPTMEPLVRMAAWDSQSSAVSSSEAPSKTQGRKQ